jgi:arylsulfatase A
MSLKLLLCRSLFWLLLPAVLSAAAVRPDAASRPNFVIIFIDDMGYGDIGPFGATKQKTPHLDRLAREGMKLTSFYAAPVCSVSRAQLLTGSYGARISVPGVYAPGNKNGLHPAEFTIAERLKERGYATMCIGKWHVGDQPEFLPTRQGFDHYLGIPYSNDMQRTSAQTGERVVPLVRDEQVIELLTEEAQGKIVERYTDEAVRFIRQAKDQPFLLYLPHTAVHTPIHPGAAFRGKSANGRFGDWVEEVDWSTGRILDTLRDLKLDTSTLVIFTSDNGPWLIKGADGGSAGPLRGGKGSTWEGGVRVPTLAWWPGQIAPGSTCGAVAGTIDLLPTTVALAGGTVPATPVIDGRDISGLLLGRTTQSPREAHYYFSSYNLQAVRQGPWKLALTAQRETMGRDQLAADAGVNPRLYNLDQEIGERTNLAAQHPEIVARLQALAKKMDAEIGGTTPTARRPAGEVANPRTLYPSDNNTPRAKQAAKAGRAPATTASPSAKIASPAALADLAPGATLASEAAPPVANRGFTIACTVETTQRDTILVAHGGLSAGYALYLKGGRVAFLVRHGGGQAFTEIVSAAELRGPTALTATLAADGAMTLAVAGQAPVTGRAAALIGRQPQEDFCVGHDNAKPVTPTPIAAPFQGRLTRLSVTSP